MENAVGTHALLFACRQLPLDYAGAEHFKGKLASLSVGRTVRYTTCASTYTVQVKEMGTHYEWLMYMCWAVWWSSRAHGGTPMYFEGCTINDQFNVASLRVLVRNVNAA